MRERDTGRNGEREVWVSVGDTKTHTDGLKRTVG